jgi:hypothetical protein
MYVCMYVCMYACMLYVCMYACMYVSFLGDTHARMRAGKLLAARLAVFFTVCLPSHGLAKLLLVYV